MATLKVTSIQKLNVQADNSTVLDVAFDILENGEVLESRRQSFPLNTTQEELGQIFKNVIDTFNADRARDTANAEIEAANARADETIQAMTGLEIGSNDTESSTEATAQEASQEMGAEVTPSENTPQE